MNPEKVCFMRTHFPDSTAPGLSLEMTLLLLLIGFSFPFSVVDRVHRPNLGPLPSLQESVSD